MHTIKDQSRAVSMHRPETPTDVQVCDQEMASSGVQQFGFLNSFEAEDHHLGAGYYLILLRQHQARTNRRCCRTVCPAWA